jgi:hypothetical protein
VLVVKLCFCWNDGAPEGGRKADYQGKGESLTGSKRPRKPDAFPRQQGYATADENDENGRS